MMSACSMPSVNTGHGVRTTQRTNALIRPIGDRLGGHPINRIGRRRPSDARVVPDGRVGVAALLLRPMSGVFSRLVGQDAVEAELVAAAQRGPR